MFGIEALDVVIGLIFVYLLFSLFVTIVNEVLSQFLQVRGKELSFSIERMIGRTLKQVLYKQPRISKTKYRSSFWYATPFWKIYLWIKKKVSSKIDLEADDLEKKITNKSLPSEITTSTFVETLVEILKKEIIEIYHDSEKSNSKETSKKVNPKEELFNQAPFLKEIYTNADNDIEALRSELESWYDEIMGYTSEWYKQKLKYILIAIGFIIAGIFNVDSISIFKTLANDPEKRALVIQQAEAYIESHNLDNGVIVPVAANDSLDTRDTLRTSFDIQNFLKREYNECGNSDDCIDSVRQKYPTLARLDSTYKNISKLVNEDINQISSVLGLGWNGLSGTGGFWDWVLRIFGWFITAIAISLGAPFWFDLLKKVVNIRNEIANKKKEPVG